MKTVQRDARGFSLLELLVAIGIMGLLAAIAIPSVSGYVRAARVTGASNMLAEDLRYGRSLASAQRKTYAVTFATSSYSLVRLSPVATVRTRALPRGVTCTATDSAKFYPWGLTSPVTFTVTGQGRSKIVRLSANGSVSL